MRSYASLFLLIVSLTILAPSQIILLDQQTQTTTNSSDQTLSTQTSPTLSTTVSPTLSPFETSYYNLKNWVRSYDGTGNNLLFTNWGSTGQPESRFCPNNYVDGLSVMRTDLPNPREVSNSLGDVSKTPTGNITLSKRNWNMLFALWGQFVEHDISSTKSASTESVPIPVPKCDQYFDKNCTGTQEISFKRSAFDPTKNVRTEINLNTAWLDGSQIYGADKTTADKLRSFEKGKLLTSQGNLLPKDEKGFFVSGDFRVNQNVGLTALHTLFMREHNRFCDQIALKSKTVIPDQQVYQMARNYVIALIQSITYDTYLNALLAGPQFDAWVGPYTYQDNINPDLFTEFNSAGFRFGHSLINSPYKLTDNNGTLIKTLGLGEIFQNPQLITNQTLGQLFNGLLRTSSKERSVDLIDDLRNFLITSPFGTAKIDLFSTNVQRGRDHGICSYKRARDQLSLPETTFDVFNRQDATRNPASVGNRTSQLYGNLDNVDLWVGIIGERSIPGSDLGDVGARLVAAQFRKIRNADRLWYENVMAPYPDLLQRIKGTKIADIIMRNTGVNAVNVKNFVLLQ